MKKYNSKILFLILFFSFFVLAESSEAATYELEITAPQPSLDTNSRYYRAYPGIEYKVPVGVFGGVYPFTYELTTYPSGMTIDSETGIIIWSNPTVSGSPHNVTVSVTDDEDTTLTRSWNITVTTTGFIFVDALAEDGGDGTIGSPFNEFVDFYTGTDLAARDDTTYDNYFVYFRSGTYAPQGYLQWAYNRTWRIEWPAGKPHVLMAYPGETAIFDHNYGSTDRGFFNTYSYVGGTDFYVQGITFQNALNMFFRIGNHRLTFFENNFETWGPGCDGCNSSGIMFANTGANQSMYSMVKDNTFTDMVSGTGNCYLKIYGTTKFVVEGNSFGSATGTAHEGVALKSAVNYADVRANTFNGCLTNCINGNWANSANGWIRFNNIIGATSTNGESTFGALTLNYHTETCGTMHIERNTFSGNVSARILGTGDGPYYFRDNVIVNENTGNIPVAGSHIDCVQGCTDMSVLSILSGNLVGNAAAGIIDASGNLQGSYRTTYLGNKGYELGSEDIVPPAAPSGLSVQ